MIQKQDLRYFQEKQILVASIDIGTNSTHLLVAEINLELKSFSIKFTDKSTTRLGERDEEGNLTEESIQRALVTLKRFKEYCKNVIKEVLEDVFLDNSIDVATLSSTHLPFLEPFLRSIFKNVKFLDPAKNIVNILKDFVEDNDSQQNVLRIFTSGDVNLFKKNLQMMGIDDEVSFLST